ncbi:gamma-glutamylcyclotransferase family protein [Aspergillus stella-maris]|uniref:gamma-glutamylcyclotransferase family protein n=1 Tax=Aspergillus stella-maris TaxID=1810926 RepID=UPI003CCD24F8
MSSPPNNKKATIPPPPPPPTPSNPTLTLPPSIKKLKTKPDPFFRPQQTPISNSGPAPTGHYFFYGTLADPSILRDVLGLETTPIHRPARVRGYTCKMWGMYPAIIRAQGTEAEECDGVMVDGYVWHVEKVGHAEILAEYETGAYRVEGCEIEYMDGKEPGSEKEYTFVYAGNPRDLSEKRFDLERWLKRQEK